MTQRTDECKATHDELCDQMAKHYDEISAKAHSWHSGIPRAIEFYRQNAERPLPTTSGDEELVEKPKQDNEALLAEQLAKDILERLDTKDFQHNPAWDIALKQIERIIYPALLTTKNQQIAAASACKVCGGTDVVCAKGVEGQIAAAKAEERERILEALRPNRFRDNLMDDESDDWNIDWKDLVDALTNQ